MPFLHHYTLESGWALPSHDDPGERSEILDRLFGRRFLIWRFNVAEQSGRGAFDVINELRKRPSAPGRWARN
jgi:hypothetical protein